MSNDRRIQNPSSVSVQFQLKIRRPVRKVLERLSPETRVVIQKYLDNLRLGKTIPGETAIQGKPGYFFLLIAECLPECLIVFQRKEVRRLWYTKYVVTIMMLDPECRNWLDKQPEFKLLLTRRIREELGGQLNSTGTNIDPIEIVDDAGRFGFILQVLNGIAKLTLALLAFGGS